jgi:DNA-binding transcriptional MerR regulator
MRPRDPNTITPRHAAAQLGIAVTTLRHEKWDRLLRPSRSAGGHRRYDRRAVEVVAGAFAARDLAEAHVLDHEGRRSKNREQKRSESSEW